MYLSNVKGPVVTVAVLPATGFEASRLLWVAALALLAGAVLVRVAFAEPLRLRATVGRVAL
jgi:hypothetical protein